MIRTSWVVTLLSVSALIFLGISLSHWNMKSWLDRQLTERVTQEAGVPVKIHLTELRWASLKAEIQVESLPPIALQVQTQKSFYQTFKNTAQMEFFLQALSPVLDAAGSVRLSLNSARSFEKLHTDLRLTVKNEEWKKEVLQEPEAQIEIENLKDGIQGKAGIFFLKKKIADLQILYLSKQVDAQKKTLHAEASGSWPLDWKAAVDELPFLKEKIHPVLGEIKWKFSFKTESPRDFLTATVSGKIHFKKVSAIPWGLPVRGFDADLRVDSVWPFRVSRQKIEIAEVGEVLPLKKIHFMAEAHPQRGIQLREFRANWANGELRIPVFSHDLKNAHGHTELRLLGVDLDALLKAANDPNLRGEGRLKGSIPVEWSADRWSIQGARIENEGPGALFYQGWVEDRFKGPIVQLDQFNDLMAQGEQALVFKALDHFQYRELIFLAARSPEQALGATLHLKGKNPELVKGMPFEFNIQLSGQLEEMIRKTLMRLFVNPETLWQNSK